MDNYSQNLEKIEKALAAHGSFESEDIRYASIITKGLEYPYELIRIDDAQYLSFMKCARPIRFCSMWPYRGAKDPELITSNFAKAYAAFAILFGKSSNYYDEYKCSFKYPFLMLRHDMPSFCYVLTCFNVKSYFDFDCYRINSTYPHEPDRSAYIEPLEEFQECHIDLVIGYLINFITGYFGVRGKDFQEDFCKIVESSNILFGHIRREYFEMRFDDQDDLRAAYALKQRMIEEAAQTRRNS